MLPASVAAGVPYDRVGNGAPFFFGSAMALIAAILMFFFYRKYYKNVIRGNSAI